MSSIGCIIDSTSKLGGEPKEEAYSHHKHRHRPQQDREANVERSKVCNVHKLMKTTFVPRQAGHTNVYSNRSHIDQHGRHNQQADNVKNLIKVKFKHQFNFDSCSNRVQIVH